jgi:transposase
LRIGESVPIDSGEILMPKAYSQDLRERVVGTVEAGASCHEAAAAFEISPSSAIRWVARWRQTGSAAAKPMSGKRSPLDAHKQWLLELIAAEADLTLEEIRGRLRQRGIKVSASSVWRFCDRHDLTCTPPNRTAKTSARHARTGSKSSRGLIRASLSSSTRPALQPT